MKGGKVIEVIRFNWVNLRVIGIAMISDTTGGVTAGTHSDSADLYHDIRST